ncbi:hypothetical protein H0E87_001367 [Populus deltoides]|uniref:Methylmalonate-semialdehyde dehydrogenase (CoA acylating) n=1 Tax=Populus deltoides TaxID=3696 RepID=A0A8T2ZQM0_POPDE|nr:hypothetical protein H0E87_001367 [Populus deltoides]
MSYGLADSEGGMNKSSSYSYNTNSSQFTKSSSASSASAMLLHEGYENGNFAGRAILSDVTVDMECNRVDSIEEAINIVDGNKYSSGASIFTSSGVAARIFQTEIEVRQVGINAPTQCPCHSRHLSVKSRNSVLHPGQDSDSTMERFGEWRFIIWAIAKLLTIILETAPDLAGRRGRK